MAALLQQQKLQLILGQLKEVEMYFNEETSLFPSGHCLAETKNPQITDGQQFHNNLAGLTLPTGTGSVAER